MEADDGLWAHLSLKKSHVNVKVVYPYNTDLATQNKKHKIFKTEAAASCSLTYDVSRQTRVPR